MMRKNHPVFWAISTLMVLLIGCSWNEDEKESTIESSIEMIRVKGGTFLMGDTFGDGDERERPVHKVTLSTFYISKYEVTQGLYKRVTGVNPSYFDSDSTCPVERVSWLDAIDFCNTLSEKDGLTPCYRSEYQPTRTEVFCDFDEDGYRLPTEAEWEFAAKGGTLSLGYKYSGSDSIDEVGWIWENSDSTHRVGLKKPNELGIHDMSGNVWEWCWDWYLPYHSEDQVDPIGPLLGSTKVHRGGSWGNGARLARSSNRHRNFTHDTYDVIGFRIVRRK